MTFPTPLSSSLSRYKSFTISLFSVFPLLGFVISPGINVGWPAFLMGGAFPLPCSSFFFPFFAALK